MILHMANPVVSFTDLPILKAAYAKIDFIAVIAPWLSETADLFADIVIPAATIEKYEGPISAKAAYYDAKTLRLPPIDPLFQSKGDIDIYIDICESAWFLTGSSGFISQLNTQLALGSYALDVNTKPTVRDIF